MSTQNEKLAESLEVLRDLQPEGRRVFASSEFSRTHRDRLKRAGFLAPVIKGWWMVTGPTAPPGDTTAWYASFWEFCRRYCEARFGDAWHLSPELSLLIHADATEVPTQVVVHTPRGTNNAIQLPFGTGLFDYAVGLLPDPALRTDRDGLRLLTPTAALVRVPPSFFRHHPVEAQVALAGVRDPSDLLTQLLEDGRTVVAGRLVGALRRIDRDVVADEIAGTMSRAGHRIRETDPFEADRRLPRVQAQTPSLMARMQGMWEAMREQVIETFPGPRARERSPDAYLEFVEAMYERDAYHSLSIEGYQVTPALVERVRAGNWSPEGDSGDPESKDALAARGYWLAFKRVKDAIEEIVRHPESASSIVRSDHRAWYRDLFQPAVAAGLLDATQLAGYRTHPVYIQGSRHVPPRADAVRDAMPALFELLERERHPAVRAVLGHWLFGYIHPFPDGNGRVARFLMNAMLASGGYPWTVLRTEERTSYMSALEAASVDKDIAPFAALVAGAVEQAVSEFG